MKVVRKLLLVVVLACVVLVYTAEAEDGKALSFDLGPIKATVTPPAGWTVQEQTPPTFFDQNGQKGSISFTGSPMPGMPEETFGAMHKAALDDGTAKVKSGDYVKAEEHAVDGFKGVLTVEAGKDPMFRRMQWRGYGRGGYYSIMMSSTPGAFDGYLPTFKAFLASVKLSSPK